MRPLRPVRALAALAAACLLAAGCTGGSPHTTAPPSFLVSPSALNATTTPLLPTDRFALPEMDYGQFQQLLAQLKGTPVVVNLWASWCGPCRQEAPFLASAARRFGNRVQFLGIDISDDRGPAQETIRDFGWSYPSLFDPREDIKRGLGFLGQPDTLFFDRDGRRVSVDYRGTHYRAFSGPIPSQKTLDDALRQLLAA
jgi:cytochrome c biogenesis protein CcmG, thiol:disulfide interchange protein DsbE